MDLVWRNDRLPAESAPSGFQRLAQAARFTRIESAGSCTLVHSLCQGCRCESAHATYNCGLPRQPMSDQDRREARVEATETSESTRTALQQMTAAWQETTEALRESEQRYRELVEYSLGLICTHDLKGTLLSINPAAANSLGYTPEDGVG